MKRKLEYYCSEIPIGALVKKAARLLDITTPFEWAFRVDLHKLNLACPEHDILGQIFGNYHKAFSLAYPENRRRVAFLSRSHATLVAWQNEIRQRINK